MERRLACECDMGAARATILSTNYSDPERCLRCALRRERLCPYTGDVLRSDVAAPVEPLPHAVAASDELRRSPRSIPRPLSRIHGNLNNSQSVVLSREGYRLLFACPNYMTFIRSCFATRTILFVGFSFSDANINELRSEARALVH